MTTLESALYKFVSYVDTFPRLSQAKCWSQCGNFVNIGYELHESALKIKKKKCHEIVFSLFCTIRVGKIFKNTKNTF